MVRDESVAGGKLKEAGTTHWASPNTGATNSSGFSALPGACRHSDGSFSGITLDAFWWSTTAYDAANSWYRSVNYVDVELGRGNLGNNKGSFSVRCVLDQ